ncbi:MAG: type IV secretory system conjugative DNA transfer family protein [Clostridia bacterium]|nr:type IV secretory system conjugative DNA transfer family protein [Clostridia bacterium]
MNINSSISKSLEHENRKYHEDSSCMDCHADAKVRNGTWVELDKINTLDNMGWPVYLSKDENKALFVPISHCLLTGSTGTGKSEVIIKNILALNSEMRDELKPSFLVTDLKGDISTQLGNHLERNGYQVRILNMQDSFRSARYNFLSQIYDDYHDAIRIKELLDNDLIGTDFGGKTYETKEEARVEANIKYLKLIEGVERALIDISHIIIPVTDPNDKNWVDGARTMFNALARTLLYDSENPQNKLTREKFTMANLIRASFSTEEDFENLIDWLTRAEHIPCVNSALAANYRLRARNTRDGYATTLNTQLSEFSSNSMSAITESSNDLNLREIANSQKPYAIFVITDDRQKTTNSVAMMLINDLVNELITAADSRDEKELPRDFIFLADEFANMPKMPNIANKITTLRSRKIWMLMAIQSKQQLDMVYGNETSAVISDNCDLHLFVGCNNDETKEDFARSMGNKIGTKTSFQISNDGSVSASKFSENVPVVRKSDLDSLTLGQLYVRSRLSQNMKSYLTPFFMQELSKEKSLYKPPLRLFDPQANVYDIHAVLERERPKKNDFDDLF